MDVTERTKYRRKKCWFSKGDTERTKCQNFTQLLLKVQTRMLVLYGRD